MEFKKCICILKYIFIYICKHFFKRSCAHQTEQLHYGLRTVSFPKGRCWGQERLPLHKCGKWGYSYTCFSSPPAYTSDQWLIGEGQAILKLSPKFFRLWMTLMSGMVTDKSFDVRYLIFWIAVLTIVFINSMVFFHFLLSRSEQEREMRCRKAELVACLYLAQLYVNFVQE